MEANFTGLYKKIENYEQNRIIVMKKTIIIGSPAILLFLSLGIYLFYFGAYIFWGSLIGIILLMFFTYIKELIEFNQRKQIHRLLSSEILNQDIIDNILIKIGHIAPNLEKSLKQRNAFRKARMRVNYLENLLQYLLIILLDLRSDLTLRLTEQQQSLESAKLEVGSNIKWTTQLDQVSELQRIRLDKQIEQFEELQRVLIKV